MHAAPIDDWLPFAGPALPSWRQARAALIASLALHAALLAWLPDWRATPVEREPVIDVFLVPPPAPRPAAPTTRETPPPRPPEFAASTPAPEVTEPPVVKPSPRPRAAVEPRPRPPETRAPRPVKAVPQDPARIEEPRVGPVPAQDAPAPAPEVSLAAPIGPQAPAPSGTAVRVPSLPRPDPEALSRYGSLLSERFARAQTYPRLAAMRGWEGEVTLVLTIARKGGLLAVRIARSSGHEILDRHALELVDASRPLPPPPEGADDRDLEITVPVRYRLRAG